MSSRSTNAMKLYKYTIPFSATKIHFLLLVIMKNRSQAFKSSENIQKKEGGPDRSVSDNQSSSVTLNELAMNARKSYCNFKLQQRSNTMTDINPNEVQIITTV